jgi:methionine synthase II (cobalamin-independent)
MPQPRRAQPTQRSTDRIITTHCGSLPRPDGLVSLLAAEEAGEEINRQELARELIRASGYSIEAANPRHEHVWRVWEDVKLPHDKVLIPGVVSHCISLVEHPELVAERILRFANVLGRERVIASNDCAFATSAAGDEVHPDVAWAKLNALVEGARLASARLWA